MGGDTSADDGGVERRSDHRAEPYVLRDEPGPLDLDELRRIDAWWRAANYLAVGQIYLIGNPLLREPLLPSTSSRGCSGTSAPSRASTSCTRTRTGPSSRATSTRSSSPVPVTAAPGRTRARGSRARTRSSRPPHRSDAEGMAAFLRQFSFPGGVPSHCAPETPGSFHEGGELGYSLLHAFGAVTRPSRSCSSSASSATAKPRPGRSTASWHCAKFLDPAHDGAVLPVLHLNQYKIANPTLLARIPEEQLTSTAPRLRLRAALRRSATTRRSSTRRSRPRSTRASTIAASSATPRGRRADGRRGR